MERRRKWSLRRRKMRRLRCVVTTPPASGGLHLLQHLEKQEARSVRTARRPAGVETQLRWRQQRLQRPSDGGGRGEVKGEAAGGGDVVNGRSW